MKRLEAYIWGGARTHKSKNTGLGKAAIIATVDEEPEDIEEPQVTMEPQEAPRALIYQKRAWG